MDGALPGNAHYIRRPSVYSRNFHKPEECSACYRNYGEAVRRPRSLPCGHTICSECIDNTIKDDKLTCPTCRMQHSATSATVFPINFCVENLVGKLNETNMELQSMLHEKTSMKNLITSCEEALNKLGGYRGRLRDWKTEHLQLQDRLVGLNTATVSLLDQEDCSVMKYVNKGEEVNKQLEIMLLNKVINAHDVSIATGKAKHWLQECEQLFPDPNTVYTSMRVQLR
nr:tripartite motif containing 13-like [Procambarus clarkii]